MPINGISGVDAVSPSLFEKSKIYQDENSEVSFSKMLDSAISKVNDLQIQSQKATEDFAAGKSDNIHQVMIIAEQASVALQFTMQIRNKVLDAYNEIMRIQI